MIQLAHIFFQLDGGGGTPQNRLNKIRSGGGRVLEQVMVSGACNGAHSLTQRDGDRELVNGNAAIGSFG